MLMSHSERSIDAYIQYKVTVVTGRAMKNVEPFWVRANGCGRRSPTPCSAAARPGSTYHRCYDWKVPFDGRIVAVRRPPARRREGHVDVPAALRRPAHPRQLAPLRDARPPSTTGAPDPARARARSTRATSCHAGHPGAQGRDDRLNAAYDNSAPHPRVMAIWHVYLARDAAIPKGCARAARGRRPDDQARPVPAPTPRRSRCRLNRITSDGRTETFTLDPADAKPVESGSGRGPARHRVQALAHLRCGPARR